MRGINYPASALRGVTSKLILSISSSSISPSLIRGVPCLAAVPQHRHGNVLSTTPYPSPSWVFFYVPNESALIRICFNRFTESARRAHRPSVLLVPHLLSLCSARFTSAEPNYSPTAPRSTPSIRITGEDSPRSAASVIGVSKGERPQTRRDETRTRERGGGEREGRRKI